MSSHQINHKTIVNLRVKTTNILFYNYMYCTRSAKWLKNKFCLQLYSFVNITVKQLIANVLQEAHGPHRSPEKTV